MTELPRPALRALLVDDSPFEREFVSRHLHDTGDVVITALAASLAEARVQLRDWSHNFDAVILDVVLPDWTKLDDTKEIAMEFLNAGKKVVIYTLHPYIQALQEFNVEHNLKLVGKQSNVDELHQALVKDD